MKKKIDKTFVISTILCLAPILLSIAVYNKLPDQVAIHWNSEGVADNYASKAFAAFGLPVIMTGLNIFLYLMMNNDPKKYNYSKVLRLIVKWIIPMMTLILLPVTLFIALGVEIDLNVYSPIFLGTLTIIIGNYLPKTKQNYTMGIKLPWTLNSEENWNKTHKIAGYIWMIGGGCIILTSGIKNSSYYVSFVVLLIVAIIPIIYSYLLYKKGI